MNPERQPSLEELSFYFDRLLDPDRILEIETHVAACDRCRQALEAFTQINEACQPVWDERRLDNLLSDTVPRLHAHIYEEDRLAKYSPARSLFWWFSPKVLGTVLVGAMAVLLAIFAWSPSPGPQSELTPVPIVANTLPVQPVIPETTPSPPDQQVQQDQQSLLAAARVARSVLNSGMEYASANKDRVKESMQELKKDTEQALTLSQLPLLRNRLVGGVADSATPPSAIETLASVGAQQVTLGIGATVLSLAVGL